MIHVAQPPVFSCLLCQMLKSLEYALYIFAALCMHTRWTRNSILSGPSVRALLGSAGVCWRTSCWPRRTTTATGRFTLLSCSNCASATPICTTARRVHFSAPLCPAGYLPTTRQKVFHKLKDSGQGQPVQKGKRAITLASRSAVEGQCCSLTSRHKEASVRELCSESLQSASPGKIVLVTSMPLAVINSRRSTHLRINSTVSYAKDI